MRPYERDISQCPTTDEATSSRKERASADTRTESNFIPLKRLRLIF